MATQGGGGGTGGPLIFLVLKTETARVVRAFVCETPDKVYNPLPYILVL